METIIGAIIGGVFSLLVCLVTNHYQQDKTRALMEYQISELRKQVEKHNGLIDRTYHLEEDAAVYNEKIKVINHRLDDLEKEIHKAG